MYVYESCDEQVVYFRRWLKWLAMFITFLLSGNDVISLKLRPLIFVYLYTCTQLIQKQIVKYNIKSKYPEEYSTVDKVGVKNFWWGNLASSRINRFLISYLISKQAIFTAFKGAVSRQSSSFCLILPITPLLQSLWNLK